MGRAMREVPAMASMEEFRKYLFVWLNPFSTYTDPKRVYVLNG